MNIRNDKMIKLEKHKIKLIKKMKKFNIIKK